MGMPSQENAVTQADLTKLYDELSQLIEQFKIEAIKGTEKNVKEARLRARTKSVEIEKKLKEFRKVTIKYDQQ